MLVLSFLSLLPLSYLICFFFFFFQAEDGIRDHCVTGVQTCALPICTSETIARAILDEGCLRPGATEPCANPAYIYLIDPSYHAIVFGYSRVMRIPSTKFDFDAQPFIKGRTYDHVVVFEVKTGALNKSLFRRSRLFTGETA